MLFIAVSSWALIQYKDDIFPFNENLTVEIKAVVRSSYLHNGISYAGKMASIYWTRALLPCFAMESNDIE